ncbi:unnamed protein product [marine sediment metagenome]|uniref:Uncharacterized protein n=1 Tax=marine sediment metagenome TaxID=412755 RepID=X1CKS3_9ZZZZ
MAKQLKLFESDKSSKFPSKLKSDRVKELQAQVEYHQHLYYNSQSEISDEEFDKLWDELKNLDPNNEVFFKVGTDFDASLDKVRHLIPMNSQAKVTSPAEL